MTELLVHMMRLPRRLQQIVAWFILVLTASVSLYVVVEFMVLFEEVRSTIQSKVHQLNTGRLLIQKAASTNNADSVNSASRQPTFVSASDAATQAALQTTLTRAIKDKALKIDVVSPQPPIIENGIQLLGIQASFTGELSSIADVLAEIERNEPPVLVRTFAVRATGEGSKLGGQFALYVIKDVGPSMGVEASNE